MKIILAAAALLAGGYATAASAQDPNTIIPSFTLENAMVAANAVNIPATIETNTNGRRLVTATTPGGLKFFGDLAACATPPETTCYALILVASFTGGAPAEALHNFDARHAFTSAFVSGGSTFLIRYEIADYGVPYGNIASNFSNFASSVDAFVAAMNGASAGVAFSQPDATTAPHVGGIDFAQIAAMATAAGLMNQPKIAQP